MIQNKKAVIFDMGSVIVDSEKLWKKAERKIFSSLGEKVSDEHTLLTQTMTTHEVTKFWYETGQTFIVVGDTSPLRHAQSSVPNRGDGVNLNCIP